MVRYIRNSYQPDNGQVCDDECDYVLREDEGYGFAVTVPETGEVIYSADTAEEAREWAESQGYAVSINS